MAGDSFDFDSLMFSSFLIDAQHIGKLHTDLLSPKAGSYVEITCASIFGFTRTEIWAFRPRFRAVFAIRSSSAGLSMLKHLMPAVNAKAMSAGVLATPEKTIFFGSPPAARTRRISPPLTQSKPAPRAASTSRMPLVEAAFTA